MRLALIFLAGLVMCSCQCMKHDKEEDEKDEVKMTMDQIPAAARTSLQNEAGGVKIDKVDQETRKGVTVYEADVMKDGKNWEIVVDANGKVISKKLDEEGEEKAGKKSEKEEDEKDEKNEGKEK